MSVIFDTLSSHHSTEKANTDAGEGFEARNINYLPYYNSTLMGWHCMLRRLS